MRAPRKRSLIPRKRKAKSPKRALNPRYFQIPRGLRNCTDQGEAWERLEDTRHPEDGYLRPWLLGCFLKHYGWYADLMNAFPLEWQRRDDTDSPKLVQPHDFGKHRDEWLRKLRAVGFTFDPFDEQDFDPKGITKP